MTAMLGISAFYHDSAAALVIDGEIVAVAQEERFTRKKKDRNFPQKAVDYCRQEAGLTPGFHQPPDRYMMDPNKVIMATAAQAFAEDGILFYDCTNDLRRELDNDYSSIQIVGDGHPNEASAKLIAEANWPALQGFLKKISQRSE